MKQRIQKILAAAGVASRRHIEEMILQGRVSVNGTVRTELPVLIDPQADRVEVDDELIKLAGPQATRRYYILMHKPKGVYTTNVAQGEQKRAIDLLPPKFPARVYPVGQLDADAKGLLLLTNDGELTNQLTHPRYGISKSYRAVVDGQVDAQTIQAMTDGIWLADPKTGEGFKTAKSQVRVVKRSRERTVLEITAREGRNREIRRMLAKLGHKVTDLTRVRMGPLTLDGLKPGESRPLLPQELKQLRRLAIDQAPSAKTTTTKPTSTKPPRPARSAHAPEPAPEASPKRPSSRPTKPPRPNTPRPARPPQKGSHRRTKPGRSF